MYYIVYTVTVVVYVSSNGSPSLCYFSQHHLMTVPCDQEEAIGVWRTLTLVIALEKQIHLCRAGHCFYFTAINNNYYNLSCILCLFINCIHDIALHADNVDYKVFIFCSIVTAKAIHTFNGSIDQ